MIQKLSLILLLKLAIQETNSTVQCETDEHCTKYPWGFKNRECIRGRCLCIEGTTLDLDTNNCVKGNPPQWWATNFDIDNDVIDVPYAPVDKIEELEEEDTKSKNGTLSKPPWEWEWNWHRGFKNRTWYWGWRWPVTFAVFALLIIVSHLWSYCKRRCKSPGEQEQPDVELSQPPEEIHTPAQPVNQLSPNSNATNANLDPPSYEESQAGLP